MRDTDREIILDKSKAFEFHLTKQDIKDTDEIYKRIAKMKQNGMTEEKILCEILMGGNNDNL